MANFNPLTNAIGGAGATNPNTYYNVTPTNFGEYEYIYISEIVDNFIAAYVGEGKILQKTLKGDVNFHAHRALQELHYDTLRSCKSIEIEVCPSLKMPVPHDYINYVKLTSVDANGIEHIIYPTRHTSHPFAIEQEDCAYVFNADGTLKHQEDCEPGASTTCDATEVNSWISYYNFTNWNNVSFPVYPEIEGSSVYNGNVPVGNMNEIHNIIETVVNIHCQCLSGDADEQAPNCGVCQQSGGENTRGAGLNFCWSNLNQNWILGNGGFPTTTYTGTSVCDLTVNAWTNYSSTSGTTTGINNTQTTSPATDNDNYFQNEGQRYGLTPEHSQANGSFFIDCEQGNIHFSSNLSGKTIILKYISDGIGDEDHIVVHKFAEEAMYKWIAYGCLSARADVPEYLVQRYKKERFAETRKAKIRLSNIKIEEIAQVMRNRSKWIKH